MNIKSVYILQDRAILFVDGADAKEFLQNLITNDINKVNDENSCYASLLTPQGKFLYDFILIKHKTGYFIDCEKIQAEALFKQLNIYRLRSNIEIMNLSNEFVVATFSYEKFISFNINNNIAGSTFKYREDPILLDPRNKELGGRLIINLEKLYLSLKKLELKSENINEYYDFSYNLGIFQNNTDKLKDKIFGIECNLEELNALDFKKGCYIGQENTARIKLKNKLSKRLLPIKIIEGTIKQGDSINKENIVIGKVMIDKPYPFATIKYQAENFHFNAVYNVNSATIKVLKPKWLNLN